MSKKRGQKRASKKRRRSSGLVDHRRDKKILTPPFLQLGNLERVSWQHDGLPDFLWIQAVRQETAALSATNDALDVLDPFVPDPPSSGESEARRGRADAQVPHPNEYLDGRISTFPLVPEKRRAEAREALRREAPWALPHALGHALALYPDCPAAWLYDDWAADHSADPNLGTGYLKTLVAPLLDPRGRPSSQARTIPVARAFKYDKLVLTRDLEVVGLLPKYPTELTVEEQLHVEQWNRTMWNILQSTSDRTVADPWVQHFWRQNWRVSACEPEPTDASTWEQLDEPDEERVVENPGPRPPTVGEVRRGFIEAIDALGQRLREHQFRIEIDTYEPTSDEVKLGLASRLYRLLRRFAADPDLWTNEMGPHILRSIIDARIIVAWLLKQNDRELFQKFKDYGLGKRKLFKLQLEKLMDREQLVTDESDQALHRRLEAEVNQDVMEEFITIDVGGSFSGKNIRQMAQETDLAELYSLNYQPLSTEAHGEWGSLIALDLRHCGNPLHRYHRLGRFDTSQEVIVHFGWVRNAFAVAEQGITEIFSSYGVSVDALFDECLERMDAVRRERQREA
jgi:hypothetical protein